MVGEQQTLKSFIIRVSTLGLQVKEMRYARRSLILASSGQPSQVFEPCKLIQRRLAFQIAASGTGLISTSPLPSRRRDAHLGSQLWGIQHPTLTHVLDSFASSSLSRETAFEGCLCKQCFLYVSNDEFGISTVAGIYRVLQKPGEIDWGIISLANKSLFVQKTFLGELVPQAIKLSVCNARIW